MNRTSGSNISPTAVIAGYVLAGGASSRFGRDKALIEIGGRTVLARMCDLVIEVTGSASVVAPARRYSDLDVWVVEDLWPGEGPLGGIITALTATLETDGGRDWNLIVSCDMPFLTREWLSFLIECALASRAEVLLPRSRSGWEPLCACWRTSALEMILPLFEAGTRKITDALNVLHVEVLDEKDWKRFDTNGRLFWNMNTVGDYEEARRVIATEKT